jgi:hypothetical protein
VTTLKVLPSLLHFVRNTHPATPREFDVFRRRPLKVRNMNGKKCGDSHSKRSKSRLTEFYSYVSSSGFAAQRGGTPRQMEEK